MSEDEEQIKTGIPKVAFVIGLLIVLAIGVGGTSYFIKMKPEVLGLAKGNQQAQAEVDNLIKDLSKLITLPSDEKPTVATVTDAEKIKTQSFFKNAQNGDKVIIYTNAKKAVLYRPSEKRIVEVGAVNINQQPKQEVATVESPNPEPEAKE